MCVCVCVCVCVYLSGDPCILHLIQYDFANNEKFITLNIASSDGKRVYLPGNVSVQELS